jgi:hypothetical protein
MEAITAAGRGSIASTRFPATHGRTEMLMFPPRDAGRSLIKMARQARIASWQKATLRL